MADLRQAIIDEARSWIGTRYHHLAAVKGAGVDCAMLLVEVFKSVGLVPPDYDPRPYSPQWFLHRNEELFMQGLIHRARRTEAPLPGDIALYRFGRTASHGAILVGSDMIIHACRSSGKVELCEMRGLANRLDSYWAAV